jgi:LacI family transcriptional regulator, galactose operon repressor
VVSDRPEIVKIKAVAERAGVSVATVSRVLNHVPTVAQPLAERVMRAVEETGYRPNGIARSLRTRTTQTIALLIPDISNPFFAEMARGVEDTAVRARYSVLLCNTDEDRHKEATYLDLADAAQVAGVILSPHDRDADISRLQRDQMPAVVVDRPLRTPTDFVGVRSFEGAKAATLHLLEQGWQRPACITGPRSAYTAAARLRGYLAAVREHEGTPLFRHADFKSESAKAAAASLLDSATPPDAILTANEPMGLGVLAELAARGIRVGRDIGLVTFDDAPWTPFANPPITVVSQPAYDIGARACELLLEVIGGDSTPRAPRKVMLDTELIVRESSLREEAPAGARRVREAQAV